MCSCPSITRSAKLMVFVRIGCLEWSEGKSLHLVLSMPPRCRRPPQCHIWETCCRRSLILLLVLGAGRELSIFGQARERRTEEEMGAAARRRPGAGAASRARANGAEESFLRPPLPKQRLTLSSVGGYLRSPEEVREALNGARARGPFPPSRDAYLLRDKGLDEVNYLSAD